jgi:site-specific recombinase XerD
MADAVDMDMGSILVMGKGRKERWMPLGNVAQESVWEYLQERARVANRDEKALWLSEQGQGMQPNWLYLMLKRLGERGGIPNLHTHRFRHTCAVNALRSGMPERVLMLAGGWKRIPETYFRTLGAEDVARVPRVHREISPADRLGRAQTAQYRQRKQGKARGKL